MCEKYVPLIISTIEGLRACSGEGWPVLYIMQHVYDFNTSEVLRYAAENEYEVGSFSAKGGVFLTKEVDPDKMKITMESAYW